MPNTITFIDGFDEYGTVSNLVKKWDSTSVVGYSSLADGRIESPDAARVLSKSLKLGFTNTCTKNFSGTITTIYIGFAFKISELHPTTTAKILQLRNSGTNACGIGIKPDGSVIAFYDGTVTNNLSTSAAALISANIWNYFEFIVDVDSKRIKLFLNGINIIDATSLSNITPNNLTTLELVGTGIFGYESYFDDLQVSIDASYSTTRISGDSRIMTFIPTLDGSVNDFTGASINQHYQNIDESTPDDNSSILSSVVSGSKETFGFTGFSNLPTNIFIQAIGWNIYAKKDTSDANAKLKVYDDGLISSGLTQEFNLEPEYLTTGYRYHNYVFDASGSVSRSQLNGGGFSGVVDVST